MKTIVIVMAMAAEAKPFIEHLKLERNEGSLPKNLASELYSGETEEGRVKVHLVLNGKCPLYDVDIVGTVGAAVTTFAAVQVLQPDLVINAGTCGGFRCEGGEVGSTYLCADFLNHDRRIPLPGFDSFGVGKVKTFAPGLSKALLDHVGAEAGVVSTGNSLDMVKEDEAVIREHKATCKDMEGAAIAYLCHQLGTPMFALKSVTDIVDGEHPTSEEFMKNLATAAKALREALPKVLSFIAEGHAITSS
jgi:5'-methylthioadenosine nucleosidase